ncbi:MAG TPA: hypothetical protein VED41_11890, partial [Solirubrobacteraceae bacterium]|nr:hypothetical protein [Solirubrobacteraceae bacterium]
MAASATPGDAAGQPPPGRPAAPTGSRQPGGAERVASSPASSPQREGELALELAGDGPDGQPELEKRRKSLNIGAVCKALAQEF